MAQVSLDHVGKAFSGANAVRDITLTVEDGTFVSLLGPSGCGKSTTLRCIAGLEQNDAGRISIGERVVSDADRGVYLPANQRDVGMVFQSYAIWPHMTVFQNVGYPLRMRKAGKREIRERVERALSLVDMTDYISRPATKLSGGQQQRVALARAVAADPSLLLLDEPLSNLDAKLRDRMRFDLRELQLRLKLTAIYVTHDQSEAMVMSDKIAVMNEGRLLQVGAPMDIYEHPANRFVADFIGAANIIPLVSAERGDDGYVTCVSEEGTKFRLADRFGQDGSADDQGSAGPGLCVRPERLELVPLGGVHDDPRVNRLEATVIRSSYLGERRECLVKFENQTLHLYADPSVGDLKPGTKVCVAFAADAGILLYR